MFEYVIVADDYTGAMETTSKFMNGGYRAAITLDPDSLSSMQDYAAVALDTETFSSTPEAAGKKLTSVSRELLPWKNSTVFFKRIDPALKGNAGQEIRTMARELKFDHVVVVPALSHGRRVLEEGAVYLDGQEVSSAEAQKSATLEATVEILRKEGFSPVKVSLEDIRKNNVADIFEKKGCFCFDAETDEDLKTIVRSVLKATPVRNVLWAGSTGLAEALAMTPKPFIVVIGTAHPRSIRQARQLLENAMAYPVQIDAGALESGNAEGERLRVAQEAETLLRGGQSILLAASMNGRFIRGSYPNDNAEEILDSVAETVREIMRRVKIAGLCVSGGDCAVKIVQKVKAENVVLVEEIQEGITLSRLKGGSFDGLPMMTKSGALGGERALVHCMEHFYQGR